MLRHMKTVNGWDVYLKIKELSSNGKQQKEISIDELIQELGFNKELVREYVTALRILDFIEFTDHSNEVFVMTDLGKS